MKVAKIIVHHLWDKNINTNDIALYKTEHPIRYSIEEQSGRYLVNSVCLPHKYFLEPDFAIVTGWGQMGADTEITLRLQKVTVPKFPIVNCRVHYQFLGTVTDDMFCYGGEGEKDSCLVRMNYQLFLILFIPITF